MLGVGVSGCVGLGFRIVGVVLVLSWTRAVLGLGTRGGALCVSPTPLLTI